MINEHSVGRFCKEDISLIENYEQAVNDTTQIWDCHHRRENIYSAAELKEIGEYFGRPAAELIFLTHSAHSRLHHAGNKHPLFGKHLSDETRKKLSKPIGQYAKDGTLIREWISANEASRTLGIASITKCCRGKLKTAGGFIWKYLNNQGKTI